MTKILDSSIINSPVPKMIELRKGFIINGQYYLKENMQPVPFNTIPPLNAHEVNNNNFMHLSRLNSFYRHVNHMTNKSYDKVLLDSQDENICYVVMESGNYTYINKYEEKNNRCVKTNYCQMINSSIYQRVFGIKEVNSENAIEILRGGPSENTTAILLRKSDLVSFRSYRVDGLGAHSSYPFDSNCEIEKDFYYKSGYGNNRFSYYDRGLNTCKEITFVDPSAASSANHRNRICYNNTYESDNTKVSVLYPRTTTPNSSTELSHIDKCTYDKSINQFNEKESFEVIKGSDIAGNYFYANGTWNTDLWHRTINQKEYIIMYQRTSYSAAVSTFLVLEKKIVQGEDGENKTVYEVIKRQEFPRGQSGEIITFSDDTELRFYGHCKEDSELAIMTSVYCYEFDETNMEFVETFRESGRIRDYGFDMDRNMYIMFEDMTVSKYNEKTVANFNARFEMGLYEYQGDDIDTNLVISTTNLEGELLAREVVLDIKGNAKFKANDSKNITVNTLATEELNIPVVITGAGSLNIFPKIKA